jgi:hypothetical protein
MNICPREISQDLTSCSHTHTLYDGGVKAYGATNTCRFHPPEERHDQRGALEQWLKGPGGVLVTHSRLFSGMESSNVVMLTENPGVEAYGRSGLLRAVANLIMVTDITGVDEEEISKHFSVIKL